MLETGATIGHITKTPEETISTIKLPFEILPAGKRDAAALVRRFRQSGLFLRENHTSRLEKARLHRRS